MIAKIRHAVILAAGRGQRMMPLTQALAKPMAPFMDSTLLGEGIARVRRHIQNVHVTVGYKAPAVAQHAIERGAATVFNVGDNSNSWWIHNTFMASLDEPIFVLTCDNVTDVDFQELEDEYFSFGPPPCMLVPVVPVEGVDGDYIFHDGCYYVTKLSRAEIAPHYCSGIQVLNPAKVAKRTSGTGSFADVWDDLIRQRKLRVSTVCPKRWFSVDTMSDLARLNAESKTE